jgi:uncharacterized damage-inducible protein DinB
MIPISTLKEIFRYCYWIRDRQLQSCDGLREKQFLEPVVAGMPAIRDLLVAMSEGEREELWRWTKVSPQTHLRVGVSSLPEIRKNWEENETAINDFLDKLTYHKVTHPVPDAKPLDGLSDNVALWREIIALLMLQLHRYGQMTALLNSVGAENAEPSYVIASGSDFEKPETIKLVPKTKLQTLKEWLGGAAILAGLLGLLGAGVFWFIWILVVVTTPLDDPVDARKGLDAVRVVTDVWVPQKRVRAVPNYGSAVDLFISRLDFESVPYPDRTKFVEEVGQAWCKNANKSLAAKVFENPVDFRNIVDGDDLAHCSCPCMDARLIAPERAPPQTPKE